MPDKKCDDLKKSFAELGLSESTLKALEIKGFKCPTPIQALTIPALLAGKKDIVGQAQTGTGKTAAFALPLIEMLEDQTRDVQALILTPTRELAIQVAAEIDSLKGSKKLDILAVYGGQAISIQLSRLRRSVHIVVGTPGRVMDHLERGTLRLNKITHVVLDEADEMLNRGFLADMEEILKHTPKAKQTLLFSATMSPEILKVAKKYMGNYELLKVAETQISCDMIEQVYFETNQRDRFSSLCRVIDSEAPFYGLIFCRTKIDTERVAQKLCERGYSADALNGNMSQGAREKILDKFKSKFITILVATDVAARGIDIKNVSHVINYALPTEPESYVHRIGRTGRAGAKGKAISFVCPGDRGKLRMIERKIQSRVKLGSLPTAEDVVAQKKQNIVTQIEKSLEKNPQKYYLTIAQELLAKSKPEELVAILLKQAYSNQLDQERYKTTDTVVTTGERKSFSRSSSSSSRSDRGSSDRGGSDRKSRFGDNKRKPGSFRKKRSDFPKKKSY